MLLMKGVNEMQYWNFIQYLELFKNNTYIKMWSKNPLLLLDYSINLLLGIVGVLVHFEEILNCLINKITLTTFNF